MKSIKKLGWDGIIIIDWRKLATFLLEKNIKISYIIINNASRIVKS